MSLVTLTELPFRKVVQKGVTTYVSDVGSVRLVVTDVSILSTDPVTYIDLLTGISYQYEYGLKLPAKINITPVAGVADSYNVNTDNKSVLMCGRLFSKTPSSTGSILGVNPDAHVSSSKNIIFKFNQQLAHAIGTVSKLEGVIVVDTFIGEVPEAFTDTVLSTITDMYNTIIPEVSPLVCGVIAVSSPYDSFVAGSDAEMYALVIKQGDRCLRTDLDASYINITGSNHSASDWETLGGGGSGSGGIDQLTVQSLINTAVLPANTHSAITVGNPHHVTKADVGLSNVPNTDFTAAVAANTVVQHSHANKTILDATTSIFTTQLFNDILTNNGKIGITTQQITDIISANTHRTVIAGNPHRVTKAEVGLDAVPNIDFTASVNASIIHDAIITGNPHQVNKTDVGLSEVPNIDFTDDVVRANTHRNTITGNPHQVTKAEIGLSDVLNHDFTAEVNMTIAHSNTVIGNPHQVTKTDVGLGNVVNYDLTPEVNANTTHRNVTTGNPHHVTKTDVGLSNVKNIDCTDASNITTGTLPTSVLPPLAIIDIFVVANQNAQLALTVQKGDVAVRTDLSSSFINLTGSNVEMSDWQELMTPIDTILTVNGQTGTVILTSANIAEGTNLYYTEARVSANASVAANTVARHTHVNKVILDATTASFTTAQANAIVANTAKVGITTAQANAIVANTAKVGITPEQASDLVLDTSHRNTFSGNPHQVTKSDVGLGNVPNRDFTDEVAANTATSHAHANKVVLDETTASFTTGQADAIVANTAKVGITASQASAIIANTAKVGISTQQVLDLAAANTHRAAVTGNIHNVTKADVGLSNVPNTDFTSAVAASTAVQHSHTNNVVLDATEVAFTIAQANAITINSAKVGISPGQAAAIVANTAKVGITTSQAAAIVASTTHDAIVAGNPHQVTKTEVGLGNVPNVDCTNASNITTGMLPSNVLPPATITDTYVADSQTAQLELTVKKGDICVRSDISTSYINTTGNNTSMADWQELATSLNRVSSVNGKIGVIVLSTSDIGEGTNLYYTEARVATNVNVAANTVARHTHTNKIMLDATNASFTTTIAAAVNANTAKVGITQAQADAIVANTAKVGITAQQSTDITSANAHSAIIVGNPHHVTKADVGLSNVPNTDFTSAVAASTAVQHSHANKAILDATTAFFTTGQADAIVANTAKVGITTTQANAIIVNTAKVGITSGQAAAIVASTAHDAIISGNPHQVTKTDVGLSNVPNVDLTEAVAASTAAQHSHANKAILDATTASFTTGQADAIVANTAKVGISVDQANAIITNTAKVGINTQQAADIVSANTHRTTTTGNPHNVNKNDIGLNNVPNVDCTNASNITTGTLPTSVLPPLSISDTFVVASQAAQLALTVQKGDIAVRSDLNRTYINTTSDNTSMADWQELSTPSDAISSVNGFTGTVILSTSDIGEGTHLYYTEVRVSANVNVAANTAARHNHTNKTILDATDTAFTAAYASAIIANTAKVGITQAQTDAIVANTAKVGITPTQVLDIAAADAHIATTTGNPHHVTKADIGLGSVPNTDFTEAVAANTAAQHGHANKTILDTTDTAFTAVQAAAIVANTAKVGITPAQANAIVANTAKVGITTAQANAIAASTTHDAIVAGNPHAVTKAEVGLGLVPNIDFTAAVNANTAVQHSHSNKVILDAITASFTTAQASAIVVNSAKVGITTAQADAIVANTAKVGITTQQSADIVSANTHRATVTGNPHAVTKAQVGLGNVPNVDCTNASNITTGTLPSSVLPALAIVDTYVAASQIAQLALTVQKGDICVRTDLSRTYINTTGNNAAMSDWQELSTPTDIITNVNGQTGTVILSTSDIGEGTHLYYTEARVSANVNVAANTAARHTHANKAILDATDTAFTAAQASAIVVNTAKVGITPAQANAIVANTAKVGITTGQAAAIVASTTHDAIVNGNPHQVTKAEVGLGNVPNTDFTSAVAASTAVQHSHTNKAILDATDTAFTTIQAAAIVANTAKVGITQAQADAIVANTAKVGITTGQAAAIVASTTHDAIVAGNPHHVTKADIGLSNVPNVDCTNASNITSGILPSSVLPALAVVDTFVATTQVAQLALTVQKGDICVRSDQSRTYINVTGNNTSMADWQELSTPTDTITSVNGFTGTVVLTSANIAEGTNLYYTEARVSANVNVAANTAARHTHANKTILDATDTAFTATQAAAIVVNTAKVGITIDQANAIVLNTAKVGITTAQASDIVLANTHRAAVTGNVHNVTKADVGLSNVPNTDFTAAVAASTAVQHSHTNKTILDAITASFTTAQASAIVANTAKVGITQAQADAIVANTAKVGITPGQASAIVASTTHDAIITGNPHHVTKADVGLGNVPNVDCTNASNITTGTLPSSVLPALAIVDTYVAASQIAQLALTVQKGDICVRSDQSRSYINTTGNNASMADWQELSTPTDTITSVNGFTGTVVLNTSNISEGMNLYYTETRVTANTNVAANTAARHTHANKTILDATDTAFTATQAAAIVANTAKVGITTAQVNAIIANTAKVGITTQQATDITSANTHRAAVTGNVHNVTKADVGLSNVPNTDFTAAVAASTAVQHSHSNKSILDATDTSFTASQAAAIVANTAKVGITQAQADAIVANTAKVGITAGQTSDIVAANTHRAAITGNVHQVTKAEVGLGSVPNTDFTNDVTLNTANRHNHANKTILDATTASFTTTISAAIDTNTAKVGITTAQANAIVANTAKVGITTQQTDDIVSANTHRAAVTGNVHNVTKAEVGLNNVPNVDCTNASNITTGTLPSSVLPALAITDTFVVASQTAQLALTVQKGDIAVRTDLSKSFINTTNNNTAMSDWQELMTPLNTILSVNGQTGTVVLSTTNISEGTNLYYTEARVNANTNVAANTAARHTHANKASLDLVSGTNTGDQLNITGNAGSANKLATSRTINSVAFDGTANIVIPVGTGDVTLGGIQTLTNKTLEAVTLTKSLTEAISAMADSILTATNGTILTKALAANTVFTDGLAAGQSIVLTLTNASTYTVTWPTISWVSADGNVAPLLSANNVFVFWKIGTTLYGTLTGSF